MQKLVRRSSFFSRFNPLDLLLELNETRELIDWDSYATTISLPLGFILTLIYFFIKLYKDTQTQEVNGRYFKYHYDVLRDSKYFSKRTWIDTLVESVQLLIIIINIINTLLFLLKKRTYTIFNKGIKTNPRLKKHSNNSQSWFKLTPNEEVDTEDDYDELTLWNPSKFSTYLFISFPPFNIAFLYLSPSSFRNLIFLLLTSLILFVVITNYLALVEDKQFIFQQTFDEYEKKFVRPKLSIAKREVSVDATKGPWGNSSVSYYSPGRREKLFRSHDLKGNETIEKFEKGSGFSPIRSTNKNRNSLIGAPLRDYQPSPLSRKVRDINK